MLAEASLRAIVALLVAQLGMAVAALSIGMAWETMTRREEAPSRPWHRIRGDVGYAFANIVVVTPLGIGILSWLGPHVRIGTLAISPYAGLALTFFLFEGISYGLHRAFHAWPKLYPFHRVHHDTGGLDCLVAFRMHPFDVLLFTVLGNLPVVMLGIPVWGGLAVVLLERVYTSLLHASEPFAISYGPLRRLFASGRFHHVHHHRSGNDVHFGGALSIFDHLFGTVRHDV